MTRIGEGDKRSSILDLIFCSSELTNLIDNSQGDDTWGSDHFPISFDMGICKTIYHKLTNRISTKKTKWKEYFKILLKQDEFNSDIYEKTRLTRKIQLSN